jgi:hypothetical protein
MLDCVAGTPSTSAYRRFQNRPGGGAGTGETAGGSRPTPAPPQRHLQSSDAGSWYPAAGTCRSPGLHPVIAKDVLVDTPEIRWPGVVLPPRMGARPQRRRRPRLCKHLGGSRTSTSRGRPARSRPRGSRSRGPRSPPKCSDRPLRLLAVVAVPISSNSNASLASAANTRTSSPPIQGSGVCTKATWCSPSAPEVGRNHSRSGPGGSSDGKLC